MRWIRGREGLNWSLLYRVGGEERREENEGDKGKRGSKLEPIVQGRGRGEERRE